jgi:hypothetical protein
MTFPILRSAAFCLLFAAASVASAAGGRGILTSIPDMPQQGPLEVHCKALKDASVSYKTIATNVGAPLTAQLTKAAEELQKKMASGTMPPRDDMMQTMIIGQLAQEKSASDPQGLCYGAKTWPDDALDARFNADSNATAAALTKAIDACPKVPGGEGMWPEPGCANAARGRHREAQVKLNDAYLRKAREGYLARQKQLVQCVITAADIDASHLAQTKGAWRAAVDPANETVQAASLAEFLTSSGAGICYAALERLPKP